MSLTDIYKEEVEKMSVEKMKKERKQIQKHIDTGNFDNMWEMSFQYTKLKILDEKLGLESVSQSVGETKPDKTVKRNWRFWK